MTVSMRCYAGRRRAVMCRSRGAAAAPTPAGSNIG
eukprot:gene14334-47163_t